jgi:uncharacterized protein
MFELESGVWVLAILLALLVGSAKGGVPGVGFLVVPLMAGIFPAKTSTGVLLPMLLMADVFAVWYYSRHADWTLLKKLFPSTIIGIFVGAAVMHRVDDGQLRTLIGVIVLLMIALMLSKEKGWLKVPGIKGSQLAWLVGVGVGLSTMLANAAGPLASIYFLAMGLDKNRLIGTGAWFFLLINAFKIPFSIGLGLITLESFVFNIKLLPVIVVGVFLGILLVKKISPKLFARLVLFVAAISAIRML